MSFNVTPARVKYAGHGFAATAESRRKFLAASPRGVAISRPTYTRTSNRTLQCTEAISPEDFFGLSLSPTLAPNDAAHIGIAIDGVATAIMHKETDDKSNKHNTLYGSQAYGVGTKLTCVNGTLRRLTNRAEPFVAYYLQKNGPNTALVWICKNALAGVARNINGEGLPTLEEPADQLDSRKRPLDADDVAEVVQEAENALADAGAAPPQAGTTILMPPEANAPQQKKKNKKQKKMKRVDSTKTAGAPVADNSFLVSA